MHESQLGVSPISENTTASTTRTFYNVNDPVRWGRSDMPSQLAVTRHWLQRTGMAGSDRVVLELGCGKGPLRHVHPRWIGLDISFGALTSFAYESRVANADIESLPLGRDSVDFVFTWAAVEHVPRPENVLTEVERVLKPAGVLLLAPAWNVRPWAASGLPVRPYRGLSWRDRFTKASILVRDTLCWRGCAALPKRTQREFRWLLTHKAADFDYERLEPNLTEYVYTDCDAWSSMDPHAGMMYFLSRGWEVLSHPDIRKRLLGRHEPVVVRKPSQ